jgi:hypothetical protein
MTSLSPTCAAADVPKTPARRDLEKEGRLDPVYKESGPKLADTINTTLRRPDSTLNDDWSLDELTLPGDVRQRLGLVYIRMLLTAT